MPPRTNAQRFFLTYSQVGADYSDQEDIATRLYALVPQPLWLEVAHELHQDGGHHHHAIVGFPERIQKPLDFFDIGGHHPNIQGCRPSDVFNRRHYLRKGERSKEEEHAPKTHKTTVCDYEYEPAVRGTPPPYNPDSSAGTATWGDIVQGSATEHEFFAGVINSFPREWVLQHDKIVSFAKKFYGKAPPFEPAFVAEDFLPNAEVDDWIAEVKAQVSVCLRVAHATPLS